MAKLLVVDDSRLTRRLLVSALSGAGHECIQATNGAEGLETFQGDSFDAVLSDLLMPVMDGFEMTAAIRQLDAEIPILVASADIQESSRQRCEENGVTRMLNKPLKPEEIVSAIEEAIANSQQPAGV